MKFFKTTLCTVLFGAFALPALADVSPSCNADAIKDQVIRIDLNGDFITDQACYLPTELDAEAPIALYIELGPIYEGYRREESQWGKGGFVELPANYADMFTLTVAPAGEFQTICLTDDNSCPDDVPQTYIRTHPGVLVETPSFSVVIHHDKYGVFIEDIAAH